MDIKIRIWDSASKRWVQDKLSCNWFRLDAYGYIIPKRQESRYVFNLSTGKFDRFGKEIWQGDILGKKANKIALGGGYVLGTYDYHPYNCHVVEWDNGCWKVNRDSISKWLWWADHFKSGEKIGNIFDNPELFEKINLV